MAKEDEYRELFLAEAQESYEELNTLLTELEKNSQNHVIIASIFRITHTLKGNASGLGFDAIAELSHVMEDIFNEVNCRRMMLDAELFQTLFRANDTLGKLVEAIKTNETVNYKGIRTKLQVALKNAKALFEQTKSGTPAAENLIKAEENSDLSLTEPAENLLEETEAPLEENDELNDVSVSHVVVSDMVQVPVRKLDELLNIVGELIIEKDTLTTRNIERGFSSTDMSRLHRITSDLQYSVMDVRLVQVGFLFNKFHRILRDVTVIEHKKANLVLEGTESEIDRNILKTISDSLVHLVRNAVSHGIETPQERLKKGKPEAGKVTLKARNEKDTVYIEISDDGNGIDVEKIKRKAVGKGLIAQEYANVISDKEVLMCLFEPGFSSAEVVTEVSGRGVGLDVVRSAVESIGGNIAIQTKLGEGTTFIMSMPSSMAVKGALLLELGGQEFAIALSYTEAVLSLQKSAIHKINTGLISTYLGKTISIVFLKDLFEMSSIKDISKKGVLHNTFDTLTGNPKLDVVVVNYNGRLLGLVVDKLTQQKEIVEKTLPAPVDKIALFSGATILGNGNMCLVLDIVNILSVLFREKRIGSGMQSTF